MLIINELKLPANTHPDVFRALDLLRTATSQNSGHEREDSLERGIALLGHLMEIEKDDPAAEFTFSLFAILKGNPESAAFFAARAVLLNSDFKEAREVLPECLRILGARETVDQYLALVAKEGTAECLKFYRQQAQQHFERGAFAKSDHYVQRIIALNYPALPKPPDYSAVLASMEQHVANGTYDKMIEKHYSDTSLKYSRQRKEEADAETQGWNNKWLKAPNKNQVALHVVKFLADSKIDYHVCVELGCHMGALMHLIKTGVEQMGREATIIGIEPDVNAIALTHGQFPSLIIHKGDHEAMISGQVPLPERISVLLMSNVCLLLKPEWMEAIIQFASTRCDRIVILDDVCNMEGDFALIRRFYLLHPFRRILEHHGFKIQELIFAEETNTATSGILVAENGISAHA